MNLDKWQKEFLATKGDKILCTGRQVGKSVICAMDAGNWALDNDDATVLMIAPTERQSYALFEKTMSYIVNTDDRMVAEGKDKPTKKHLTLTNGTKIWSLPTGLSGRGVRFLTIGRLYADETSRIPQPVFDAVSPMLATTGGDTVYLSTPAGKEGEFYDCWANEDGSYDSFTRFHVDTETVFKERKICLTWSDLQREKSLAYLAREKIKKTALVYAQEYLGKFLEELRQFFKDELLRSCMTIQKGSSPLILPGDNFLGVDVAGMGGDEIVQVGLNRNERKHLNQISQIVETKQRLPVTVRQILAADNIWKYRLIGIDDGGIGTGVFDPLLEHSQTKRKVVALNNASRPIDNEGHRTKLLKEDMYTNLLLQMEQRKINLFKNNEIFQSLRSVQAEYTDGKLKIFGNNTHIAEALVRAAWVAKNKRLNIWIRSS